VQTRGGRGTTATNYHTIARRKFRNQPFKTQRADPEVERGSLERPRKRRESLPKPEDRAFFLFSGGKKSQSLVVPGTPFATGKSERKSARRLSKEKG